MAQDSGIEWTDDTVNPWWGCAKVSPACKNCYAENLDRRFRMGGEEHWGVDALRYIRVDKAIGELDKIARRSDREGRPRRVFIASMADVFEDRADLIEPRKKLWDALHRLAGRITPLLLTKRPDTMAAWAKRHGWPAGAMAGTTAEDQRRANERIPSLLRVPAVRFLSCEPLLGPIDLDDAFHGASALDGTPAIGWVIAGGESGPGARPSHPEWFRSLRLQCASADIPFFFKQWGAWVPRERGVGEFDSTRPHDKLVDLRGTVASYRETAGEGAVPMSRVGKHEAGRILDHRTHDDRPGSQA